MSTVRRDIALEAIGLGKRYRRGWALRDCTFEVPAGRISALVGPNGAGKSTLMALATGLLRPTAGAVRVLGDVPGRNGAHPKLGFLSQDKPLYRRFTVDDMLRAARLLNPAWDDRYARGLVRSAGVPVEARINTLSGGQQARVALALALGRRPSLLLLDEPVSNLDPLAREEVMRTVMVEVAESGTTVLLSSHVLADLTGVCDHLVVLAGGRTHLAGDMDEVLAGHRLLIGPRRPDGHGFPPETVVESRTTARQETLLVRDGGWRGAIGWEIHEPTLEELTMAYLRAAGPTRPAVEAEVAVA
ncbi:MAG: ATP-binding cassette domain-containing protein [Actinocatenispora sp.]